MSRPPMNPMKSLSGIAIDPQTLERVIPESKRADGTVRKQIKIRPGFTPKEDVGKFRGTKQAEMDARAPPKGHKVGWSPPEINAEAKPVSKSAKKNARRREKKREEKSVPEDWEDDQCSVPITATTTTAKKRQEATPMTDCLQGSPTGPFKAEFNLGTALDNLEI